MQDLEPFYYESLRLIDSCPDLTTNKIPDHLLCLWLYNGDLTPAPSNEQLFSLTIFKYASDKYGGNSGDERHLYEMFQYVLALEYVCRRISTRLRPRRIFDFSRYDEPVNIDMKRNQIAKFNRLAATLAPLQGRSGIIKNNNREWN